MGGMGSSETKAATSSATPLTVDKQASIREFIFAFEEKKRKKKEVKPVKKDDDVVSFSPLTAFMRACA